MVAPDENIARNAGVWKVKKNDLSLADCFALSTPQEMAQLLLATDSTFVKIKGVSSIHLQSKNRKKNATQGAEDPIKNVVSVQSGLDVFC